MIDKIKAEIERIKNVEIEDYDFMVSLNKCLIWAEELEKNLIKEMEDKVGFTYKTAFKVAKGIIQKQFHSEEAKT